jgi:hypothetical protein
MGASLSQIQTFILSHGNPAKFLQSRPDVAAILDRSLTGCTVLFSCLNEEIGKVSKSADGHNTIAWKAKARMVWKNDTFKELLDGLRGQQLAITLLLQLLQMCVVNPVAMTDAIADCRRDSLSEIKQLLKQKDPHLRKLTRSIQSLRLSYPSVDVAESIYDQADYVSTLRVIPNDSILGAVF